MNKSRLGARDDRVSCHAHEVLMLKALYTRYQTHQHHLSIICYKLSSLYNIEFSTAIVTVKQKLKTVLLNALKQF